MIPRSSPMGGVLLAFLLLGGVLAAAPLPAGAAFDDAGRSAGVQVDPPADESTTPRASASPWYARPVWWGAIVLGVGLLAVIFALGVEAGRDAEDQLARARAEVREPS